MTKQTEEIEVLVTLAGTHDKAFAFVHLENGSNLATVRAGYAEDVAALIRERLNPVAAASATAAPGTEPRGCPTPGACSCPAVRVEEEAIGHARYEYVRTLSPRQFAAMYDEALHGDRFDDLVDRYRDAGGQP